MKMQLPPPLKRDWHHATRLACWMAGVHRVDVRLVTRKLPMPMPCVEAMSGAEREEALLLLLLVWCAARHHGR